MQIYDKVDKYGLYVNLGVILKSVQGYSGDLGDSVNFGDNSCTQKLVILFNTEGFCVQKVVK